MLGLGGGECASVVEVPCWSELRSSGRCGAPEGSAGLVDSGLCSGFPAMRSSVRSIATGMCATVGSGGMCSEETSCGILNRLPVLASCMSVVASSHKLTGEVPGTSVASAVLGSVDGSFDTGNGPDDPSEATTPACCIRLGVAGDETWGVLLWLLRGASWLLFASGMARGSCSAFWEPTHGQTGLYTRIKSHVSVTMDVCCL